ncbi:MAG TPA: pilus assembly protein TadG-related protein [Thermomicrobiales bacterium]|nr:pilus assembly protein TadG-related protein [Thermomicrobiales bacterium]
MGVRHSFTRRVPHQRFPCLALARHGASGQVMIIFALASLVLVGVVALSVDTGFLMAERRQTQSAADAAALAGAKALFEGESGQIVSSAQAYGAENADVSASDVIVNWPPATGEHAGDNQYVQVTISKDVDKFFLGAVYSGNWEVGATAVAGIEPTGANYALITLDRTDDPGIYMNGNTTIRLIGDQASAYGSTDVDGNGKLHVTGSVDSHGEVSGVGTAPGGIHENMPYIDDPMADVPAPSTPATTRTGCSGDCNLQPGYYKNQTIHCKNDCTFAPGLYYFDNTSVTSQNTNSQMNGNGVMFYFTGSSYFDSKNGEVNLIAPTTSPYAGGLDGVVFWMDTCQSQIDFQGNGDFYMKGIFYAPCSAVTMHGNPGGDSYYGQVIVGTFSVKGTSDFRLNYNSYVDTKLPKIFLVS